MAETKKRVRVFSIIMVGLFFVTSFGFSFLVIWEAHENDSNTTNSTASTTSSNSSIVSGLATNDQAGSKLDGFTPTTSIPYLQTKDLADGTGAEVKTSDTVTVNYTGAVAATGTIFQSSYSTGQAATFSLTEVIKGWQLGIPGMKVGGTRELLIPAALAYGANPPSGSGIPANANLVFYVTLEKIS